MKPIKIKLHSSVDLITNSSTVIFTYSEGAVQAVRELVNEMLKVFGHEDKKFDDLFYADTFLEEEYQYSESNSKFPDDVEDTAEFIRNIKNQVLKNEIDKPDWMVAAEEHEGWSGYQQSTELELMPKDEKYSELANMLLKYLTSTSHEATRDG